MANRQDTTGETVSGGYYENSLPIAIALGAT